MNGVHHDTADYRSQYDHPDDPRALNDEGLALDVAETILGGMATGCFGNQAEAIERLARWASANGYQHVPRDVHERLERGEAPERATPEPAVRDGERAVEFECEVDDCQLIETWRAVVPVELAGDELHDALIEALGGDAEFIEQRTNHEEGRSIRSIEGVRV